MNKLFNFSIDKFAQNDWSFYRADLIVRYLYYFLAVYAYMFLGGDGDVNPERRNVFDPVWTIQWAQYFDFSQAITIVLFFFFFCSLIGALFFRHRIARIMAFLGVMQMHAFLSSFSEPDHRFYPLLYLTFLFIFLPNTTSKIQEKTKEKFLLVFFVGQTTIMLLYSMSGFGKLLSSGLRALEPEAFALHIAHWLRILDSTSLLGPFIIENPYLGWPIFVGGIYLTLFSLWAVFKPPLHKLWAVGLILFHVGNIAIMDIHVISLMPMLLFMFFYSPFYNEKITWKEFVQNLPGLDVLIWGASIVKARIKNMRTI